MEKALELAVQLGRKRDEADYRNNLAGLLVDSGLHDLARHHAFLSKEISDRLKASLSSANIDFNLGRSFRLTGEVDQAVFHLELALRTFFDVPAKREVAAAIRELAYIRIATGAYNSAAVLLGADEAIRAERGIDVMPSRRAEYYRNVNSTKGALGTRYVFEHQKGFMMNLGDIRDFLMMDTLSMSKFHA